LPPPPGLAEDRDVAGITAKGCDIVVHPAQGGDDVEHPGIVRMHPARTADIGQMQKAEYIETMVDADHDGIAAARQVCPVGYRSVARTVGKGAAVQPHHDRPFCAVAETRRPQIERQTILGLGRRVGGAEQGFEHRATCGPVGQLPRAATIDARLTYPGPRHWRMRRHKAVVSRGRGAIGHAFKRKYAGALRTA
jgi:hypothetical protein